MGVACFMGTSVTLALAIVHIFARASWRITFSWTTEYAFSVNLNTEKEGEWVNTGFTAKADNPQNGVIKKIHNEWYYFENEKLEQWYQTIRKVLE